MKIEIKSENNQFFSISLSSNEENIVIPEEIVVPEVVEELPQPPPNTGAPIENFRQTNSFDFFEGTSWAGKKNSFD